MPVLALLLTLTAALLWAPKAEACSCASAPRVIAPVEVEPGSNGAPSVTKAVPTNGKLWFSDRIERDESRARIVDSNDEVIDGRWSTIDAAGTPWQRLHVFHPAEELSPGNEVRYQLPGPDDSWQTRVRIPVGDGPDVSAPSPPSLRAVRFSSIPDVGGTPCESPGHPADTTDALTYRFDVGELPQPALVALQLEDTVATFDPQALDGHVELVGHRAIEGAAHACSTGSWVWTLDGQTRSMRWGGWDLAGNFSGWSDWHEVSGPDPPPVTRPPARVPTGCGAGFHGPVIGLALFFRRRRLRST